MTSVDPTIVYYWCRIGYEEINNYLRRDKKNPSFIKQLFNNDTFIKQKIYQLYNYIHVFDSTTIIKHIENVHKNKLTAIQKNFPSIVRYSPDENNLQLLQLYRGAYYPQTPFKEEGFMSFTYDPYTAYKFGTMYSNASDNINISQNHKILYLKSDVNLLEYYKSQCAFLYLNEYENGINEFEILFKPGTIKATDQIDDSIIDLFKNKLYLTTDNFMDIINTMRETGRRFDTIPKEMFRKIIDYKSHDPMVERISGGLLPKNVQKQTYPVLYRNTSIKSKQKISKSITETTIFKNTGFGILWRELQHIDQTTRSILEIINGKNNLSTINKETDTFFIYHYDETITIRSYKHSFLELWEYIQKPMNFNSLDRIAICGDDNRIKVISFGTNIPLPSNKLDEIRNGLFKIQPIVNKGGYRTNVKPSNKGSTSGPFISPSLQQIGSVRQKETNTIKVKQPSLLDLSNLTGINLNPPLLDLYKGGKKKVTKKIQYSKGFSKK